MLEEGGEGDEAGQGDFVAGGHLDCPGSLQ